MVGDPGQVGTDAGPGHHLGDGDAQAPGRNVVHPVHLAGDDQRPHEVDDAAVELQVKRRQVPAPGIPGRSPQRSAQRDVGRPEQNQAVPIDEGGPGRSPVQVVDHAKEADDGRGINVGARRLVVEADVATDNRDPEGDTGLGNAVHGLRELPHHLGVLGIAEVEAVHDGQRSGPNAGQVHQRLGDHPGRTTAGVDGTPAVVAVGGHGQAPTGLDAGGGVPELQHRGIVARTHHRVQEQLVVVLPVDPGRIHQQVQQVETRILRCLQVFARWARGCLRCGAGTVVQGCVLVEGGGRHVGQHLAVEAVQDAQRAAVGDPADDCGPDLPPLADGHHPVEAVGLHDGQHPLLGFAGHDLVGLHPRLPSGHGRHVHVHADPAARRRLAGGTRQPGATQVLDADNQPLVEQLEARLD